MMNNNSSNYSIALWENPYFGIFYKLMPILTEYYYSSLVSVLGSLLKINNILVITIITLKTAENSSENSFKCRLLFCHAW